MDGERFTLIDDGRVAEIGVRLRRERVQLTPAALHAALGWALKAQGLCKDDRCVPLAAGVVDGDHVDLAGVARLLGRPLALDAAERAAYLGAAADERAARLTSLDAPDFTLPDLAGQLHRLADYRGRKVLLVAYASW
jgi:hypothetical protein